MDDLEIVNLYWKRNERALEETAKKYGKYCYSIAYNLLSNHEDSEESVNDTYIEAWNAIPPHKPSVLSTFLGKITRRIAIDKWRCDHAEKRGGGEVPVVLEELAFMAFHTEAMTPGISPMQQELLDKHYLRKHGKNAYYGQG